MSDPAIEIVGLTKRYGATTAVEDVNLTVGRGAVVGLLGPNGAGKSTTLKALVGAIRTEPAVGRIARPRGGARAAEVLGFALDPAGIDAGHRVRRHLQIAATSAGVDARRVDEAIEAFGLRDLADRRAGSLSTGQRQRLALATAQLGRPPILVLDEPATGLDADGIRWLRDHLRRHADAGGSVLLSSHMLFELEQIADDVVLLDRTVRFSGPLDALTGDGSRTLESAYFDVIDGAGRRTFDAARA